MADLFMTSGTLATSGPTAGIGYFARFGVTEKLIRDALSAALSKGGDYADLFFQHRVTNSFVARGRRGEPRLANVELGVGVRVVKATRPATASPRTSRREGLKRAAQTAAAIADGPAREAPQRFHAMDGEAESLPGEAALGGRPAGAEAAHPHRR